MDIRKVKKLIELLEESNIDEIEIKEGEESVRISRNSAQAAACRDRLCSATPLPPPRAPLAAPALRQQTQPPPRRHQRPRGQLAHGWHVLPLALPQLPRLSKWADRKDWGRRLHRGSDEDDEPDRGRQGRHH